MEEIDVGEALLAWETWDRPPHDHSRRWYITAGIIGGLFLVYAIASANFLFATIVLMMGLLIILDHSKKPERINIIVTDAGIVYDDHWFPYEEMKDFSIVYQPGVAKILYIDFLRMWKPLLHIPVEDMDPNILRETLLNFVFENLDREEETLTDHMRRLYKF